MSFQIRFEVPASPDLTQMLAAVQRQLNWQGVQAQGSGGEPSAASGVSPEGTISTHPHPHGHPHPTIVDLFIVAAVALVVGFVIGRLSVTRAVKH